MNRRFTYIITATLMFMSLAATAQVTVGGSVFGGGNKAVVKGNSSVTISQSSAIVEGDVYGGGALAHVNADFTVSGTDTTYFYNEDKVTTVDLTDGTINGDVYGGGLGRADDPTTTNNEAVEAKVYGPVTVNIGAASGNYNGVTINGSVFGCNNINGTPLQNVFVHVYKTAHTTGDNNNRYPEGITTLTALESLVANPEASTYPDHFAIKAVYGGGNKASYIPAASGGNITVHVHGCSENTIQTVYGGGNAADVGTNAITANTNVIIDGGFIDRVFGGGNGYSATHNHDMPFLNNDGDCDDTPSSTPCPDWNPGANIYGTATTEIKGGLYRQIFGGNNQYGNVTTVNLTFNKDDECSLLIHESFGGANEADIQGDVVTNLICSDIEIGNFYGGSNLADIIEGSVTLNVYGGTYTNVFGGSKGRLANTSVTPEIPEKSADIEGNVTLNLFGGTMENAFGGSDVLGNIEGKITVNVFDYGMTGCSSNTGLHVNNIYGGGNLTAYTPNDQTISSPEINLIHGTISKSGTNGGNVFGGSKGGEVNGVIYSAIVASSPVVNIGYDADIMGTADDNNSLLYSLLNNPDDNITYLPTVTSSDNYKADVEGSVYGGGEQAAVKGSTTVYIRKSNTIVNEDVYGGGALADVNTTGGNNPTLTPGATTSVSVSGGQVKDVYGGGLGSNESGNVVAAKVYGPVTVNVSGNASAQNVFGCNNENGAPQSTVQVNIQGGTVTQNVYGGGNLALYGGCPEVNITDGIVKQNVFGGGNQAGVGQVGETLKTQVNVSGGTIGNETTSNPNTYGIYGGCNDDGTVTGNIEVNITGGTLGATGSGAYTLKGIYGGGKGSNTRTTGNVTVTVKKEGENAAPTIYGDVYGGSALGWVGDGTDDDLTKVDFQNGVLYGTIYGGGMGDNNTSALVKGDVQVDVTAGSISAGVYGGCNVNGTVTGGTTVGINGGTINPATDYGAIYGGGLGVNTNVQGTVALTVGESGAPIINGDVYGGSAQGLVNCTLNASNEQTLTSGAVTGVTITNGTINGNVYGGGHGIGSAAANVWGPVTVNVNGGSVNNNVFGCNNAAGSPKNTVIVNINSDVAQNVYGGGNVAPYNYTTGNYPEVNIKKGIVGGNMFGGGLGANAVVTGNPKVTIGATGDGYAKVTGNVFGGGDAAAVTGNTIVEYNDSNTNSSVANIFGGGNNIANNKGVSETATVRMTSGKVTSNVYGGCNTQGTVGTTTLVKIKGGAVQGSVFGGGFGEGTAVTGKASVHIIGTETIVNGDVFGGGDNGTVGGGTEVKVMQSEEQP